MTVRYSKFLRPIILTGDFVVLNLAFLLAYYFKLLPEFSFNIPNAYILLFVYVNIQWLIVSLLLNRSELSRLISYTDIAKKTLQAIILHFFSLMAVLVFIKTGYFSRVFLFLGYTFLVVLLLAWRLSLVFLLRNYRRMGYNHRAYVVVGYGTIGEQLVAFLNNHPEFGYHFKGFFDIDMDFNNIQGNLEDLEKLCAQEDIDEIYCSLPNLEKDHLKQIAQFADKNLVRIKIVPDIHLIGDKSLTVEKYGPVPIVLNRKEPLEVAINRNLKRLFDIGFSLLVIVCILSWLVPLVAILIKLDSPGPIFFLQKRGGKNGKHFWCLKFRTMYNRQEKKFKLATQNDSRITRVGKILRKTSLDEFPQFINVLKGDMTIVGPRPHAIEVDNIFQNIVDKYMVRYFVKPGITGLAQIKGFRGNDDIYMKYRIRMDVFYVENWTFLLDLKIILKTITHMIHGDKNAF